MSRAEAISQIANTFKIDDRQGLEKAIDSAWDIWSDLDNLPGKSARGFALGLDRAAKYLKKAIALLADDPVDGATCVNRFNLDRPHVADLRDAGGKKADEIVGQLQEIADTLLAADKGGQPRDIAAAEAARVLARYWIGLGRPFAAGQWHGGLPPKSGAAHFIWEAMKVVVEEKFNAGHGLQRIIRDIRP